MDDGESEDAEIERRSKAMVDGLAHGAFGKRPDAKQPPKPDEGIEGRDETDG
jgi:hypothetical protein